MGGRGGSLHKSSPRLPRLPNRRSASPSIHAASSPRRRPRFSSAGLAYTVRPKMQNCRPPPPSPLPPPPPVPRRRTAAGGSSHVAPLRIRGRRRRTWGGAELVAQYERSAAPPGHRRLAWASAVPHDLVRLPWPTARPSTSVRRVLAPARRRRGAPALPSGRDLLPDLQRPGHCAAGQKLRVEGSATVAAFGADGAPLLHVASFARLYTLLVLVAVDGDGGHAELTRGFTTEAVANSTLELLWCLAPHCGNCHGGPGGAGAGGACPSDDWEGDGATNASCTADVYTLAGAIERKRPIPRLAASRGYYDDALRLAGAARAAARRSPTSRSSTCSAATRRARSRPPTSYAAPAGASRAPRARRVPPSTPPASRVAARPRRRRRRRPRRRPRRRARACARGGCSSAECLHSYRASCC